MDTAEKFDELLEEVIEETENNTDENVNIDDEENLEDLLEEDDIEDYYEADDEFEGFIPQTIDLNSDIRLDEVKLDEYLKATYAFKETQQKTFDEYKKEELEKEDIKTIKKMYDEGHILKGFETFDDFLKYKRGNHIFFVTVGLPFEKVLFDIDIKVFICRAFTSADYLKMLKETPEADVDFSLFNKYLISRCVLFPEIPENEVENLELGVQDILIPALMKHSRLNSNYEVQRL